MDSFRFRLTFLCFQSDNSFFSVKVKLSVSLLCVYVCIAWRGRPWNDQLCVERDVKSLLTHLLTLFAILCWNLPQTFHFISRVTFYVSLFWMLMRQVLVSCYNSVCVGPVGDAVQFTVFDDMLQTPPANVSARPVNSTSIIVSFVPPQFTTNRSDLHYVVTADPSQLRLTWFIFQSNTYQYSIYIYIYIYI